jgi:hypothetical protein
LALQDVRTPNQVLAMIDTGAAEKLEKLIKMLSSDRDGEVVAAARAIKRTLDGAGSDIHEFAERIKGAKLSEADMQRIYNAGLQDGKDAAAVNKGFSDVAGPSWHEMAVHCAEKADDRFLYPGEREFIDDMVRWTARREPSEKQGRWLHKIYVRLGKRRR